MRRLTISIIAVAVAWSVYWFIGARREASVIADWFEASEEAEYKSASTRGFPNRFDTNLEDPSFDSGPVRWSSPFLQILRLSYARGHYVIALDRTHSFDFAAESIVLATEDARASVVFDGTGLDRAAFTFDVPSATSDQGWTISADRLLFAIRRNSGGFEVGVEIPKLQFGSGEMSFRANGILAISAGYPEGNLDLTFSDPSVFHEISGIFGWPTFDAPVSLTFSDGSVLLNDYVIGLAPKLQ